MFQSYLYQKETVVVLLLGIFAFSIILSVDIQNVKAEDDKAFWERGPEMPTPRTEVSSANLGKDIYVIGGFDQNGHATDIVEVYNVDNHSWSTGSGPLSEPLHHTAALSYSNKVYVIGGFTDSDEPSDKLYVYDPMTNKWSEDKAMPTARGALNVNLVGDIFYAIGGAIYGHPLSVNEAYDPNTDTWTTKAPMPTPRHHAASSSENGSIYIIGGRVSGSLDNVNITERYDPKSNDWSVGLADMPSERSGIAAASVGDAIYVFGGEYNGGTFDNNERYNPLNNTWNIEPSMPTSRHGLGAVAIDDKIFVIGGGHEPGLSVSNANEIFSTK